MSLVLYLAVLCAAILTPAERSEINSINADHRWKSADEVARRRQLRDLRRAVNTVDEWRRDFPDEACRRLAERLYPGGDAA